MNNSVLFGISVGLIGLGLAFIFIDLILATFFEKLRPDFSVKKNETELISPTERELKLFRRSKKNYESIKTHRMRKGGLIVIGIGLLGLIIIYLGYTPTIGNDHAAKIGDWIVKFQQAVTVKISSRHINIASAVGNLLYIICIFIVAWQLRTKKPGSKLWLLAIAAGFVQILLWFFN